MGNKNRKPLHLKKKREYRFSVCVDPALFAAANAKRTKSWPELVERMFGEISRGVSREAVLNTAIDLLLRLESDIKSEYGGTKSLAGKLAELDVIRAFLAREKAAETK